MPAEDECSEIFEIYDRVTRCRVIELVFLSANDAFEWLGDKDMLGDYRVQSVEVWRKKDG